MRLTYRPFEWTDDDIESFIQIADAADPGSWSVEEVREHQGTLKPGAFFRREFVEADGKRVGVTTCRHAELKDEVGAFHLGLILQPECREHGYLAPILRRMISVAENGGARSVIANAQDDCRESMETLRELGFELFMRLALSELDIERFDPSPFASTLLKVERQGITFRSVAELIAAGADWMPSYVELEYELSLDVPESESPQRKSVDELRRSVADNPDWHPQGRLVALDGKQWIGLSVLTPHPARSDAAEHGLTGVVRSHRRRGIATALKVAGIERARKAGFLFIETINEGNNPMLQLNLGLGFRHVRAYLTYRKEL
jgi:mycothiol synthase